MNEGKAKVITTVLKQQGPFKAIHIVTATGLSRQLVHKHLTNLVSEGYLEKDGVRYGLVARNELLDALMDVAENSVTGLIPKGVVENFHKINPTIELSILLSSAGMPGHIRFKASVNSSLDTVIRDLKAAKRYHNLKKVSKKKAAKKLEATLEDWWQKVGKDKETVSNDLGKILDAIEDGAIE